MIDLFAASFLANKPCRGWKPLLQDNYRTTTARDLRLGGGAVISTGYLLSSRPKEEILAFER
jgi:hypothetical protein